MTAQTVTRRPVGRSRSGAVATTAPWTVVGFAALAVAMRLPYVGGPMSSDEGGFLYVARHWGDGGGSLYGRYWVDRPPLLIMLFRLGDLLGGLTGLRLLGCAAAAVTVLALGLAVRRVLGRRAATWASAAACLAVTAPLLGAVNVNGELLATPFVALGVLACGESFIAVSDPRRVGMAFASGACAVAAVMVKQNFVDVLVFAVVLALAMRRVGPRGDGAGRHRPLDRPLDRPLGRPLGGSLGRVLGFAGGAAATLGVVLSAAAVRGTSPGGVFFAMYPFRIRAAGLIGHLPLTDRLAHLDGLGTAWIASAAPLLLLALVVAVLRRRVPQRPMARPVAVATLALAAYDVLSIGAGGSYWMHYLVQLAPATAIAAGLLGSSSRAGRALVATMLVLSGISWAGGMSHRVDVPGQTIGESIRAVSRPGDTVVSLLGAADVVEASGLTSPYRYLWSLPARTLDPHLRLLAATLERSSAPTWVVVRGPRTLAEIQASAPGRTLSDRYHRMPDVCGRRVYLRDGVDRAAPSAAGCRRPLSSLFNDSTMTGALR